MTDMKTRARAGLSSREVEAARRAYGKNEFSRAKKDGFFKKFLANLGDPVIKVLLAALAVNVLMLFRNADWFETIGIAVSVFLATFISTLSEYGSEAAFSRLLDLCGAAKCRVRRAGTVEEISTVDVVVGDIVLLGAGERIPADGMLLTGELAVDQSPLTGESREAEKRVGGRYTPADPACSAALFAGCTVLSGEGEFEVTRVGDATYLGGISGELQQETRESPLKVRLARLARQISRIGYAAAVVCVLAFLFHRIVMDAGFDRVEILARMRDIPALLQLLLQAFTLGLTVVVVAVPEGLPMMIAVVLSSNIRRMVRDNVLVRKPVGLEAAGSMNILFTDKTGTLTAGKLTLDGILTSGGDFPNAGALKKAGGALFDRLSLAIHAGSGATRGMADGVPAALGGNSTDRALITAFLSYPEPIYAVRARLPFDSARNFAAARSADGRVLVMGAPERLLPHVSKAFDLAGGHGHFARASFSERVRARMADGARVLLICEADEMPRETLGRLTLLAAVSFSDPLRPEAREAVATLRGAGVQVVMITGDGKETASHIAAACGILGKNGVCLEGRELAALSDDEVTALLPRLAVIARALPADKSRLVRLSEAAGLVVGMTGDGINDAPALKLADVGFSMGSGTQVAKEASDIVILDDNLASVTRAVLYGRTIFKSIRKFITLQLVMNFCAAGITVIGPFIGFDMPVTVVQMLWINIIMDTLGGLAFAGEAPMPLYMKEPPKKREEPILTRAIAGRIVYLTVTTLALSVIFLKAPFLGAQFRTMPNDLCLLTAFFAFFIFAGVLNCFNARTDRVRLFAGIGKNHTFLFIMAAVATVQTAFVYLGGAVLRTVPLLPRELAVTLVFALAVIPLGWIQPLWRRLSGKNGIY